MPRAPKEHRLATREARENLQPRGEPYWRQIVPGTFLGLRKGKTGSAWVARQRTATGGYAERRIGTPDDHAESDGEVVINYSQAVLRATSIQIESRQAPSPRHYGDGVTLNDVFDRYIEDRAVMPGPRGRVMSAENVNATKKSWDLHMRGGMGRQLVTSLNDVALRQWHAELANKPPVRRGRVQPYDSNDPEQVRCRMASANRILSIPKAALSHAREAGLLPNDMPDFWLWVKPFGLGDPPPPRMLTEAETRDLLYAAREDDGLHDLIFAALMTGARFGDLRRLRVKDFSVESGLMRIDQGKNGKTLWQPLTDEGVAFFAKRCDGRKHGEHILLRDGTRAWGRSMQTRPFGAAVEAAGLSGVTLKTMRATYGKLLLLATRDIELVAQALGHSDSRITRRHYAQYLPNEVATGIQKLPALGGIVENVTDDNRL